jgi:hypothetical protein
MNNIHGHIYMIITIPSKINANSSYHQLKPFFLQMPMWGTPHYITL